jgi:hypothetical protein
MRRGRAAVPIALGAVLVAAHAAALPLLVDWLDRPPLVIDITAPPVAPGDHLQVAARMPAQLAARARVLVDGVVTDGDLARAEVGPGLHRVEWRVEYRGGVVRRAGIAQLVGPYQDPAQPPCSGRLLFGQRLLDDGAAGPGTLAGIVKALAAHELGGFDRWPVGRFERVRKVSLRWVAVALGVGPHLRADIDIDLSSASIGLTVRIAPRIVDGALKLSARTGARVHMASRVAQWVVDLVSADAMLARFAHREIASALDSILTAPPPLDLGGGRSLELVLCPGRDVEIVADAYAAVPLAVRLDAASAAAASRGRARAPVLLAADPPLPDAPLDAAVAIELDGNALGGALYVLWATGLLEEELARSGVVERFHADPLVADLLSVRVRGPELPLPPTLTMSRVPTASYQLGVVSSFLLDDGDLHTPAHLFGRAGFQLGRDLDVRVSLSELGLTCQPSPGVLEPCYPELAAELVARAPELHDELSSWFSGMVASWLVGRDLGPPDGQGSFRIDRSRIVPPPAGRHGPLRIELEGQLSLD